MTLSTTLHSLAFAGVIAIPAIAQDAPTQDPPSQDPVAEDSTEPADGNAIDATAKKIAPMKIGARLDGEVSLKDIDGKLHTAKDFLGSLTVVNFWSTKCPVMQVYENKFTAIQEDYAKKGVNFLHVNANETNGELADHTPKGKESKPYQAIRSYLAKYKLDRRVLVDHKSTLADLLGAKTTPNVFVFGKSGKLLYRGLIDDDFDGKQGTKTKRHLRDALDAALAGKTPALQATTPRGCSIKRAPKPKQKTQ